VKKTKILQAMAAITVTSDLADTWYKVQASASNDNAVDVMIYGDIGAWGISSQQFAKEFAPAASGKKQINVHLHSLGGDILEGLAIYNMIKNHPATVDVFIGGIAASMGSVIAMAGDTIHIPENAWMMVHKPWGIQGGNADDMREYADLLDQFESSLMLAYTSKTGKTEDELSELLAADTWLMGQDAIDQGFADKLTDAVDISASISTNRIKDYATMPKQAKNLLVKPAASTNVPKPKPNDNNDPNGADALAQFKAQDKERRTGIQAAFKGFEDQHGELLNSCLIDVDVDVAQAKDQLLAALGKGKKPAQGGAHIHVGNGSVVREHMGNALAARAGLETIETDNGFRGMTLQEMARASLSEAGISPYGMDRQEMIGMAFTHTSSDFGEILSDVARKSMLKGAKEANETFQDWTTKGQLSDFKPTKRVGLDSFPTLDKVPDGGEYKYATINDTGETIQLATYGKLFSITRQTIINDDLGVFSTVPSKMGRAAIRTVGNLVYAVLLANPKMADGKALFHADHKNLLAASGLTAADLDKAAQMMALHQDSAGSVLNIEPEFLIVPRALKARASQLVNSMFDPDGKHSNVHNIAHGIAKVVADARIDAAIKSGQPLPWFMAAGNGFDTIEVGYLDGNDTPYLEQQNGWSVDGTEFKVRLDAGVSALSHRTLVKNPGQ